MQNDFSKVSQYDKTITDKYGYMACGLIAAAAIDGLTGEELAKKLKELSDAAGKNYTSDKGIQPDDLVEAMKKVYSNRSVVAHNNWTLTQLYISLERGEKIIVDFTSKEQGPSKEAGNYSHFARVLGVNPNASGGQIYIQNTLSGSNAYWTVRLETFFNTWIFPERDANIKPDGLTPDNDINRWAVSVK